MMKEQTLDWNYFNLGKEVDLQNHIKAISSNFVGFNIFIKSKTYRTFSA